MKIRKYLSGKMLIILNIIFILIIVYQFKVNDSYYTRSYNLFVSSYHNALIDLDYLKHKLDESVSDNEIDSNEYGLLQIMISKTDLSLWRMVQVSHPVNKKSTYINEIISSLAHTFSFLKYEDINIITSEEMSNYLETIIVDMNKVYPIELSGDLQINLTKELKDKIVKDIEDIQKYLKTKNTL